MKIAVLNECFLSPEDKIKLQQLGELIEYQNTTTQELAIERLKDVDIAIVDGILFPSTKTVLESTNTLKLLILNTTGYDGVDMKAANSKNIKVVNAGSYANEAVAEQTFLLMLSAARRLRMADKFARSSPTPVDPGHKDHQQLLGFELKGKTLGIVGLGHIGCRVGEIATGFGMEVIAYNRSEKQVSCVKEQLPLGDLLKKSDVVSLHLASSAETKHIIGEKEFSLMKPSSILINTARGNLVDSTALQKALETQQIAGAGLDVLEDWSTNNSLFQLQNVVITPHISFFTQESLARLSKVIVENVKSFLNGNPINIVDS